MSSGKARRPAWPTEEYEVTFQIALIGKDGLVVGSDRKVSYLTEGTAGQHIAAEKYIEGADKSIVCFFAGSPLASNIARRIASTCANVLTDEPQWGILLAQAADNVAGPSLPSLAMIDEVLVVRPDVPKAVWLVSKLQPNPASVQTVTETICTGANLTSRFLPRYLWSPLPLDTLRDLALLTLSFAERENPSGVGRGFDVLTLEKGNGFKWTTHSPESAKKSADQFLSGLHDLFKGWSQTPWFR
jgi:hypothetical protein